jgi:hypothetical protein
VACDNEQWDQVSLSCITCKGEQKWNKKDKQCACPANLPNFDGFSCVFDCPADKPIWNGKICVSCPSATFYDNIAKTCKTCPEGLVYSSSLKSCEVND